MEEYAKNDSRFHILDLPHQGTGKTRNIGMEHAVGKYITFCDPDDFYNCNNVLSSLYNQAESQKCDMIVFDYNILNENGEIIKKFDIAENLKSTYELKNGGSFDQKNILGKIFESLSFSAWNKFLNKDFVKFNKLHFLDCNFAEDRPFVLNATLAANKIGYSKTPYYNYVMHKNSAMHTKTDKNFCVFKSFDAMKHILEKFRLTEVLSAEFDKYVVKRFFADMKRMKSPEKYYEIGMEKFSPLQNERIYKLSQIKKLILDPLFNYSIRKK